jgi:type III secretion protein L
MRDRMPEDNATLSNLPNAPGSKIIRAGEESAWRDGFRFLAEIRALQAAERTKAYAEGKAAGSLEASKLVAETSVKVQKYLASLDKQVAQLAFDIVQRILSEFDDRELVARAARNALADFREAKSVRIQVHPSVEAHLRRAVADLVDAAGEDGFGVLIETDTEIGERICVLSTEFAVVEATIETQLAAIAQAMGLSPAKAAE